MPTLQKLADRGLMYSQWHRTALCSPARSTFLTGRNHHVNGCSCITEAAQGFPGWSGRLPAECATIGQVDELAKQTQNPISSLITFPFQTNWDVGLGDREAVGTTLNVQPLAPFSLTKDVNVILRVIMLRVVQAE